MKRIAFVAAFAALAACGDTTSDAPVEAVIEDTTATTGADGGPSHGTFKITRANGEVITEVLSEDGTFTATDAQGQVTTGTWEQKSPSEYCAKDDDDEEMKCFAEAINEDGVWTSTDPEDGEVSTVERVVEEEPAEPAEAMTEG